jgi:hypothetical protein
MRSNIDWIQFAHPLGFIRLILLVEWDPIRILGEPRAMDEYDRYAVEILDLLQSDKGAADLSAYLNHVQSDLMGQMSKPEHLLPLAEKIYRTYHIARNATQE